MAVTMYNNSVLERYLHDGQQEKWAPSKDAHFSLWSRLKTFQNNFASGLVRF
jgi:hypothetical protein